MELLPETTAPILSATKLTILRHLRYLLLPARFTPIRLAFKVPECEMPITAITSTPSSIRIYRADQATLLNGGQITAPHFISFYSKYGCLRFMDWQTTNSNVQAQWQDRPKKTNCSWIGLGLTAYGGIFTQTSNTNDFTAPTNLSGAPTSWTDGMLLQGCFGTVAGAVPTSVAITNITINGTTGVVTVTAPAHGFSSGASVFFPSDSSLSSTGTGPKLADALIFTNPNSTLVPFDPGLTITNVTTNTFDLVGPTDSLLTISSGTYNSSTGLVTLTMASPLPNTNTGFNAGQSVIIRSLTGTGSVSSLIGTFTATNRRQT